MPDLVVGLDLLDREILDVDGKPVGKVDDVEVSDPERGPPEIVALLMGPTAYGRRLGGRIGRWIEASGAKLAETDEPIRIPMTSVAQIDVSIRLSVPLKSIERATRLEDWLRERFVGRIPGAHRASE
ncbi:MAG: hypothetical protein GEU74_02950 [Nitriliruptorales bacterium]|nr:hypothetical protein [Nitriliruptorales bacterium]